MVIFACFLNACKIKKDESIVIDSLDVISTMQTP
jgi:hypothetical protein